MNCKYLSKSLNGNLRCKLKKKIIYINECSKCLKFYSHTNRPIKNKTSKLKKLEKERFSIFTNELDKCYYCKKTANDMHEVWGGSNRQRCMKYGLCIPLCRTCHSNEQIIMKLRKELQEVYIDKYGEENFYKIIGKRCL